MKLTTLIMITIILHVSATTLAQKVTLNEKNARLVDVFNEINKQTDYDFVFTATVVKDAKPVTINVKNEELKDALGEIFQGQDLDFSLDNKIVVIKAKEPSLIDNLKNKLKADMASVTIRGQVTDETGQPMPSVSVREKGTQNGTVTDIKGAFSLTVINNDAIVIFSYVGYETKELTLKDLPANATIILKAAENNLREVVINKGYYNERQELSTGNVGIVNAKTIGEQPVSDPMLALEGQVAGLYITQNSGLPGGNEVIRIRGQNSIANGSSPLFIIDGVPFSSTSLTNTIVTGGALGNPETVNNLSSGGSSPFNVLNPDDIANIEVLKDADATAIYGSRGANGVILITTKKGHAGDTRVDLNLSQGAGQVTRMMDLMNTQQYLQMRHAAFKNDGVTPSQYDWDINGDWDTTRYTNWQKVLFGNTAHYTNAQLAISGGTENTQFYIGAGFNRQTTVYPGDNEDAKASLNFNLTHFSANKRFQLQFSAGYGYDYNQLPQTNLVNAALSLAPDAPPLYSPDGSLNWQMIGGSSGYVSFQNPLSLTLQTANAITNNLTSSLQLSYKILPGLQLSSRFGYGNDQLAQTNIYPGTAQPPPINPFGRSNNYGNTFTSNWIIEPQVSYDHKISKGNLNVLVGATFSKQSTNETGIITSGYSSDALIANPLNASSQTLGGDYTNLYKYNAVYARVGYTWADKYLLNLTARRDGSSNFGPGKQWGNFGSVGAGWIFSKESLIADKISWLSFGKLRGSYGITGSDQITPYNYLSSYTTNSATYQGVSTLGPARIANPYYSWEVNKKLDIGIDLGFLKDRINLTADWFRNRTGNQLVNYPLPSITGFTSIQENLPAVVQNTGYEFTLNTVNFQSSAFKWSSTVNLSLPNNKLVSFPGLANSTYATTLVVGQSLYIQKKYPGTMVNPADGVYEWKNASGVYTESPSFASDRVASKPVTQQMFGGFTNSFGYKAFQLDIFFEFVKQNSYNYFASFGVNGFGHSNQNAPVPVLNEAWQTPDQVAQYGRFSTKNAANPHGNLLNSDFIISNGSFVRLKNLAFSYALPKTWQQAAHLQNTRIYLQAQNLFTITNYFGLDPETANGLPPLRMITLGVKTSL